VAIEKEPALKEWSLRFRVRCYQAVLLEQQPALPLPYPTCLVLVVLFVSPTCACNAHVPSMLRAGKTPVWLPA